MSNARLAKKGLLATAMAAAISAGICSTTTPKASATLLAYEPFNYPAGTSLVGTTTTGTGFTGVWQDTGAAGGTQSFTVSSGSLTYPNLVTSANSVTGITPTSGTYPNDMADLATSIAAPTAANPSVTTWYSVLIHTPSNTNRPGGITILGKNSLFAGIGLNGSTYNWGISYTGGSSGALTTSTITNNTTYLMVLENVATYTSGTESDTWNLFVDPTAGLAAPDVAATVTNTTLVAGTVKAFGVNSVIPYSWDEIRIGTTYASVTPAVPEPAALSLLLLGGCGLLLKKRRPLAARQNA